MPSISYKIVIPEVWNKDTYQDFLQSLLKLGTKKYKEFNEKITSTKYEMIGINIPILRNIAKKISKTNIYKYLRYSKNHYFEEVLLQGLVISYIDDYDIFVEYFRSYVKRVDNWALCDTAITSFTIIKENKERFINIIDEFVKSDSPFYVRVGVVSLLTHYVDDKNYLDNFYATVDNIHHDNYYVKMSIAWFLSVLFVKYRTKTIHYLNHNNLDDFTMNKTVQKIRESFRVSLLDKKMVLKYKR
ncbi:MAG: DNA alkylation repair protein [Bacilli bacterium]|nr:DNA alkylation repair protein [Bacilli bacterium]